MSAELTISLEGDIKKIWKQLTKGELNILVYKMCQLDTISGEIRFDISRRDNCTKVEVCVQSELDAKNMLKNLEDERVVSAKHVIEGLILLANTALMRIRVELETVWVKSRIIGPISDVLVALRGLRDVVEKDIRLSDYIGVFIETILRRRQELIDSVDYSEIEHHINDWGSIFQSLEEDCLKSIS